jgi:hypothetical protein
MRIFPLRMTNEWLECSIERHGGARTPDAGLQQL